MDDAKPAADPVAYQGAELEDALEEIFVADAFADDERLWVPLAPGR